MPAAAFAGCATVPSGKPDPRDPWERFNRSTFKFNDTLDRAIAKPVAKAYIKVTPSVVRTGISNVFTNLDTVSTIVNNALQGKIRQAGHDSARFLLNSTLGLGGLVRSRQRGRTRLNDEDFGQTLGKWGVESGPYLMLPLLGPVNGARCLRPRADQYTTRELSRGRQTRYIIRGVELIDLRAGLLELDAQLERSYDRYAFIRNAWIQRREYRSRTATSKTSRSNSKRSSWTSRRDPEDRPGGIRPPAPAAPAHPRNS